MLCPLLSTHVQVQCDNSEHRMADGTLLRAGHRDHVPCLCVEGIGRTGTVRVNAPPPTPPRYSIYINAALYEKLKADLDEQRKLEQVAEE